ncbi:MAG TPA: energy transducer TonB [Steroidobacteraceae bacterium]|nr:energy transducer TonB [Steroidobacteraceae bacterium]
MASAASSSPRGHASVPAGSSPGHQPSPHAAIDVTALTTRDEFLLELGQALGGQAAIRPVDSTEAALESLKRTRRTQVLVIDADGGQLHQVRPAVEAAEKRAPHAVTVVFAPEGHEKQVAAAVKGTKVFAVLPIPVDPRKTQAIFGGVIEEAAARKADAHATEALEAEFSIGSFRVQSATVAEPPAEEGGGPSRSLLIVVAVMAALAVAAGAGWYFLRGGTSAAPTPAAPNAEIPTPLAPSAAPTAGAPPAAQPATPAATPAVEVSLVQGKVDELLEKARLAMRERHYTEPPGENALLYYRSAAAADPGNGEAHDGLGRVATVLAGRFDEAMNAGRLDEAAQSLAGLKSALPADPRIGALSARLTSAEISKALADGGVERAAALLRQAEASRAASPEQLARWRTDIARRQEDAKLQRLAGLVEERIRDGHLTDPANDSAAGYVRQLTSSAPASASTQRAQHDLSVAYLRKAHEAALARNSADEDQWLNAARSLGTTAAEIAAFQKDLAGARAKAAQADADRLAGLARDRMREGRLTDPAQDSAAYYLTQLQSGDPNNAAFGTVSRELAGKLLERARAAALAGKSAEQDLAQAQHWGADPKDVLAVRELHQSKPKPVVDLAALAAHLKQVRSVAPDYPASALQRGIAGSVLISFTVDAKGAPRDVEVVQSTPAGVFDRAAVSAVKRWRYAPMIVDGAAVEVPARTLVRFELPK